MSDGENKKLHDLYSNLNSVEWLSLKEAAIYLRYFKKNGDPNTGSVRNLMLQGRITFYKPFGRVLFKRSELDELIQKSFRGGLKKWQ